MEFGNLCFQNRDEAIRLFKTMSRDMMKMCLAYHNPIGNTILHTLAEIGDAKLFEVLFIPEIYEEIAMENCARLTPFDIGVMCNNLSIIKMMLSRNLQTVTITGLHIEHAIVHRNREMIVILMAHQDMMSVPTDSVVLSMGERDGCLRYVRKDIPQNELVKYASTRFVIQIINISIAYRDPYTLSKAIEICNRLVQNGQLTLGDDNPTLWLICLVGRVLFPVRTYRFLFDSYFETLDPTALGECVDILLKYGANPLKTYQIRRPTEISRKLSAIDAIVLDQGKDWMNNEDKCVSPTNILLSYARSIDDSSLSKTERKRRAVYVKKCGDYLFGRTIITYGRHDIARLLFHLNFSGKVEISFSSIRNLATKCRRECDLPIIDEIILAQKTDVIWNRVMQPSHSHILSFPRRITLFDLVQYNIERLDVASG